MSSIKKELRLTAVLDDAKLRSQIQQLKKEFGEGIKIGTTDLKGLEQAFQKIATQFTDQITKAISSIKMQETKTRVSSGKAVSGVAEKISAAKPLSREKYNLMTMEQINAIQNEESKKVAERLNRPAAKNAEAARQAAKALRSGGGPSEQADAREKLLQQMEATNKDKHSEDVAMGRRAEKQIATNKKVAAAKKAEEDKIEAERLRMLPFKEREARRKAQLSELTMGPFIKGSEKARSKVKDQQRLDLIEGINEQANKILESKRIRPTDVMRGAASSWQNNAGQIAAAGGAVSAGIYGMERFRQTLAEREFRSVEDAAEGRHLESIARQQGRSERGAKALGFLGGGALGLGGALATSAAAAKMGGAFGTLFGGPVGTAVGAGVGLIGGGIAGAMGMSQMRGETRVQEIQPLIRAVDEAKSITPQRMQLMRGGTFNQENLTAAQARGVGQGFAPSETLQHLNQARDILGNRAAEQLTAPMQRVFNQTGVGISTQAQATEAMTGAEGTNRITGNQRQFDAIKKGVAAGLDSSKSGQFLRETTQYIQDSTGFGRVDTDAITTRLSEFARGFSQGGEITDTQLRQARELAQLTKQESTSKTGVAGIGNLVGTQRALGANASPGQLMAAMNLSSDATIKDIQDSLGVDEETARKIQEAKQSGNAMKTGLETLGVQGTPLGRALAAEGRGITTEQQLGTERGMKLPSELVDFKRMDERGMSAEKQLQQNEAQLRASKDFTLTQREADAAQKRVVEGFNAFDFGIAQATKSLDELAEALRITKGRLEDYADGLNLKVSPGN